jgi:type IV pilus assembly protein PilC
MPFNYVASTKDGKVRRGVSELGSRHSVVQDLERQGLIVVSVTDARFIRSAQRAGMFLFGKARHIDVVLMTKHLSVMLNAGLSLLESLGILEEQAPTWQLRRILRKTVKTVEQGKPLSEALEQYPRVFSAFYVNIIRAGEVSGNLETNLEHLATQLSKDHELRARVRSAMLYPTIVVIAAAAIGFFFATYIIPQVSGLFASLKGVKLPWVTIVMIDTANFTRKYTFATFFGGLGGIWFLLWFLRRRFLAPVTHWILLRLPIVGPTVRDVNLARFAMVMGTMLKSGIPITTAIQITSEVLDNFYYRRILRQTLSSLQEGVPLSDGLIGAPRLFPKIVSRMISVGERSGRLEDVLRYLAEYYDLEVQTTMRNLANILEPVLLVVIGLIALGLAYAIIIPIYNFIGMINKI